MPLPLAQPYYYAGLGDVPDASAFAQAQAEAGPSEEAYYYVFNFNLTANGVQPYLYQPIDGDSDFMLRSIHGSSTGTYNVSFSDNGGKPVYSSPADARNVVGSAQLPVPVRPALYYPAASRIGINLTDTSGAPNTVQLIFSGIRRYRTH